MTSPAGGRSWTVPPVSRCPPELWSYADGSVTVQAVPFHEYTVSFLAYLIWDPVHMYNATTNGWTNFEHQITF